MSTPEQDQQVWHQGSCHCGAVQFKVLGPERVTVIQCNCSICHKKQNLHFIVPKSNFKLMKGDDVITTYTFNTRAAKHTFCSICGVQSFYTPRSNPDGVGIMPHCIDGDTLKEIRLEEFNGQHWEDEIHKKDHVRQMSKERKKYFKN